MDTEVISLAKMKTEAGRNLDADVNATTLIAGEKADGTFGVFNFFQGIKNFFKGISALGTLASGSRLPVTDSNGNVTYTTMNDINSYVINNALTNYQEYKMQGVSNVSVNDCIPTNSDKVCFYRGVMTDTPYGNSTAVILTSKYYFVGSYHNVYQEIEQYGKASDNYKPIKYIRYGYKGTRETEYAWSPWQKVTTESDLWNYTARTKLDHGQNTSTQYLRLLRIKKGNQYSIGYSNFILSGINAYGAESAILGCCINSRRTPNNWSVKQIIPLITNNGGATNLKYTETETHYELWVQLPSYHAGITITKLDEYLNPDWIEWAITIQNSITNVQNVPNIP